MKSLQGVFYFDFRPVPEADRARLGGSVGWPDVPGFASVQGAERETGAGTFANICSWNGRLDNRGSLEKALGVSEASEATLTLAVYRKGGWQGLRDLIGDWSAVLYDASERTVILASDYACVRPLYYCADGGSLVWSSHPQHLLRWKGQEALDDVSIARFLTAGSPGREGQTLYQGIRAVAPGRAVRVSARSTCTDRFWKPPVKQVTRYRNEDEYESQLFRLFEEAVSVRLKSKTPVVAELSGGLDSTAVVCMAQRLIVSGQVNSPKLIPLTYEQPGSGDEPFVRIVEEKLNLTALRLEVCGEDFLSHRSCASSPLFWEGRFSGVASQMNRLGSSSLLTGQLGDLVMANWADDSEQAADLLAQGRVKGAVHEAFTWSQYLGDPVYSILWNSVRSCVSAQFRPGGDLASSGEGRHSDSLTVPWAKKVAEQNGDASEASWLKDAPPSRRKRLWALNEILEHRRLACPEPFQNATWTHPFSHRPLVEFAMTVPPAVMCRPGVPRRLMRRAFRNILPGAVLSRKSKATYTRAHMQALRPLAREFAARTDRMRLVEMGFVDGRDLAMRLERLEQGLECNEPQLRRLILLELWLSGRSKASQRGASLPKPDLSLAGNEHGGPVAGSPQYISPERARGSR